MRLKFNDFDSSFQARAIYYSKLGGSGTYKGSASQNRWLIQKMKEMGYKKGSSNIPFDQMSWIHDGEVVLKRVSDGGYLTDLTAASKVLTEEQVQNMLNWSKMNPQILNPNVSLPSMPTIQNRQVTSSPTLNVDMSGMQITANDPDQFAKQVAHSMQNYKFVKQIMNDETLGNALGHNSLNKYRH